MNAVQKHNFVRSDPWDLPTRLFILALLIKLAVVTLNVVSNYINNQIRLYLTEIKIPLDIALF